MCVFQDIGIYNWGNRGMCQCASPRTIEIRTNVWLSSGCDCVTAFDRIAGEIAKMPVDPTNLIGRGPQSDVQNPEQAEKFVSIVHQTKRFSVKGQGEIL
jgi:hypothetical protein